MYVAAVVYDLDGNAKPACNGFTFEELDASCYQCGGSDGQEMLLLCDGRCGRGAHTHCVGLGDTVPEGDWFCSACASRRRYTAVPTAAVPEHPPVGGSASGAPAASSSPASPPSKRARRHNSDEPRWPVKPPVAVPAAVPLWPLTGARAPWLRACAAVSAGASLAPHPHAASAVCVDAVLAELSRRHAMLRVQERASAMAELRDGGASPPDDSTAPESVARQHRVTGHWRDVAAFLGTGGGRCMRQQRLAAAIRGYGAAVEAAAGSGAASPAAGVAEANQAAPLIAASRSSSLVLLRAVGDRRSVHVASYRVTDDGLVPHVDGTDAGLEGVDFRSVMQVFVASDGAVFIADSVSCVYVLTPDLRLHSRVTFTQQPFGVCANADVIIIAESSLSVASTRGCLSVISRATGQHVLSLCRWGVGDGDFGQLRSLCLTSDGSRVAAVDTVNRRVSVVSVDGSESRHIGRGVLKFPVQVGCSPFDELVVADVRMCCVYAFDVLGQLLLSVPVAQQRLAGVAVHGSSIVVVTKDERGQGPAWEILQLTA